jgi:dihydrofolate synthase / folylpolyglutamate synthase
LLPGGIDTIALNLRELRGRSGTGARDRTERRGKEKIMPAHRPVPPEGGAPFRNVARLAAMKPSRMNLSLTNISALLERLGDPQRRYPAVLVAGTNGKGSVTTYVSSVLRAAGLRVGTYYSPHIFRLHERIRLDGREISSRDLDALVGSVRSTARGIPLTYFECLTAAAAQYFFEKRVDAAVFEVGLGGRLDATNLVNAVVTVITGISHDHREHLGRTKRKILAEKLGVARAGAPLVANLAPRSLVEQAAAHCAAVGAPFHPVGDEVEISLARIAADRMTVRARTRRRDYGELATRMIGRVQVRNVATALRAVEMLEEAGVLRNAGAGTVRRGIASAFLAGRFQTVSESPRIVLDVAHNEESLLAALDTVRRVFPRDRTTIVFAALAHKELGVFPARAVAAARAIIVTPLRDGRSATGDRLGRVFGAALKEAGGKGAAVSVARGVGQAIREARGRAGPSDTIVIMGSHVTVEEAAPFL